MKALTDARLETLRKKRAQLEAMRKKVIDFQDSELFTQDGFQKLNAEYEQLLAEFGAHGEGLLATVDNLQAQLQASNGRLERICNDAESFLTDWLDSEHVRDVLKRIVQIAGGEGGGA